LALDTTGEVIPLKSDKQGKPVSVPGLNFALEEAGEPFVVCSYRQAETKRDYLLVSYGKEVAAWKQWSEHHQDILPTLMQTLFVHSQAELNVWHMSPGGMPLQPANFPQFPESKFQMATANLPDPKFRGTSVLRYNTITRTPTRADIFVNVAGCVKEAEILGFPARAVIAGYLANEAYGMAVDTFTVTHKAAELQGRKEAGSTGAQWATQFYAAYNQDSPFFAAKQLEALTLPGLSL
jgi:hypothetical protein